jgi:hypothetical protein
LRTEENRTLTPYTSLRLTLFAILKLVRPWSQINFMTKNVSRALAFHLSIAQFNFQRATRKAKCFSKNYPRENSLNLLAAPTIETTKLRAGFIHTNGITLTAAPNCQPLNVNPSNATYFTRSLPPCNYFLKNLCRFFLPLLPPPTRLVSGP